MATSKIFLNNTTQAVRLSKEVAFDEGVSDVEIFIQGEARVIVPQGRALIAWMQTGPHFSDDFLNERDQPPMPADSSEFFE